MTSVTAAGIRRVGLLGGTFDPPHIGHLVAAVSTRHALALDEVRLVPNGDPWQKRDVRPITPAEVRLAMVRAAAEGLAGVTVSDVEVSREGPSYTFDTIEALRAAEPDVEPVVVLGRDAAGMIDTWFRYRDVLSAAEVAVVSRGDGDEVAPPASLTDARVHQVAMPRIDVSSSDLRRRVGAGEPIDVLVPAAVVELIEHHCLYRSDPGRAPRPGAGGADI